MDRLRGFDYKRPSFYMVTLERLLELAAFSQISDEEAPPGWCWTRPAPQNRPPLQNAPARRSGIATPLPCGVISTICYNLK